MLTPAEEMGLAGLGLASRIRRVLHQLSEHRLLELYRQVERESMRQRLIYLREGREEVIRVMLAPLVVLPEQLSYLHSVSLTIHNATRRLIDLYLQDPQIHEVLALSDEEDAWLRACWGPRLSEQNTVFGRLDAVVDLASAGWRQSLSFVEPNMSGIGGLHLIPGAERVLADVVLPVLHELDPHIRLELGADVRDLLMELLLEHAEDIGRPARRICFVEPKYSGSGPEEQSILTEHFHRRYQVEVCHADPAELTLRGDEVLYQGQPIDLAYRDYSVQELIEAQRGGVDIAPMRTLLQQNRVVSSLAAELDQKAIWEVFTDPALAAKHFTVDERHVFRRHIPWTRKVSDRRTLLPDGSEGELLEYCRSERELLVLKPNRDFGGHGVLVGPSATEEQWETAIQHAVVQDGQWVVQRLVHLPVHEFPVLGTDGRMHPEPFYGVLGLAPTEGGLAILGRVSQKLVVNVAQRGGLCGVFLGHSPPRLLG